MFASSLIVAIVFMAVAQPYPNTICLREKHLAFTQVHLRFELKEASPKEFIVLRVPVDCSSGKYLIPKTIADAVTMLDEALPLNYKTAAIKGDYINSYKYGHYGVSAEEDMDALFAKIWQLRDAKFCASIDSHDPRNENSTCFIKILQTWRKEYTVAHNTDGHHGRDRQ